MNLNPVDGQVASFLADARPVHVGHPGAGQRQVADGDVVADDDKQRLAHARLVGNDNPRPGALDHQIVGAPNRAVEILSRGDLDMVAVLAAAAAAEGIL